MENSVIKIAVDGTENHPPFVISQEPNRIVMSTDSNEWVFTSDEENICRAFIRTHSDEIVAQIDDYDKATLPPTDEIEKLVEQHGYGWREIVPDHFCAKYMSLFSIVASTKFRLVTSLS